MQCGPLAKQYALCHLAQCRGYAAAGRRSQDICAAGSTRRRAPVSTSSQPPAAAAASSGGGPAPVPAAAEIAAAASLRPLSDRHLLSEKLTQAAKSIAWIDLPADRPREATKAQIEELQSALGYRFKNLYLLRLALIHSSAAPTTHNGIMAWIGDAALYLVVAEEVSAALGNAAIGKLRCGSALLSTAVPAVPSGPCRPAMPPALAACSCPRLNVASSGSLCCALLPPPAVLCCARLCTSCCACIRCPTGCKQAQTMLCLSSHSCVLTCMQQRAEHSKHMLPPPHPHPRNLPQRGSQDANWAGHV